VRGSSSIARTRRPRLLAMTAEGISDHKRRVRIGEMCSASPSGSRIHRHDACSRPLNAEVGDHPISELPPRGGPVARLEPCPPRPPATCPASARSWSRVACGRRT